MPKQIQFRVFVYVSKQCTEGYQSGGGEWADCDVLVALTGEAILNLHRIPGRETCRIPDIQTRIPEPGGWSSGYCAGGNPIHPGFLQRQCFSICGGLIEAKTADLFVSRFKPGADRRGVLSTSHAQRIQAKNLGLTIFALMDAAI